jgi:hypothetical protein
MGLPSPLTFLLDPIVIKEYNSFYRLLIMECRMTSKAPKMSAITRQNAACAKTLWPGECSKSTLNALRELTTRFGFSVRLGEIRLLNGAWYVTNSGLIRLADRRRCQGIDSRPMPEFSDPVACRWVFRATVFRSSRSKGFVGYGDADPSNTSSFVRGAEMRVAETRAVNRALRKAYGIGLCSVEELGSQPPIIPPQPDAKVAHPPNGNGSAHGQPRLRDKLCLLIRKYELDPNLVKRYAADFCGTETLGDASRDLVEAFVSTVAEEAAKDRSALICKLNSYSQTAEMKS